MNKHYCIDCGKELVVKSMITCNGEKVQFVVGKDT